MKRTLYKLIGCALLLAASVLNSNAENGIIETKSYTICPGESVTLSTREITVWSDTVMYDTIIVAEPTMDSVYRYMVNVYPPFMKQEYRELEYGETIEWCDTIIDRAGTYEKVYHSIHGCDSIHRLVVTERHYTNPETHIMDTLCAGSSMTFGGKTLTEGGIYRDTIHLSHYDSIVILTLNLYHGDTVVHTSRIPEGTSVTWNGETYSEPGIYDTLFANRFGCDSLSRLELTVYHVDTIDTTAALCPMETITWHGMTYGQTGDYEFPGTRSNGDKVYYRLHLTVKELARVDTTFTLCDNETLTFHGKTYANAGEYTEQYTCDSLFVITIVKYPSQLYLQTGVLDATHPYLWQYVLDGETKTDTITAPGVYEYTSQNAETGCNDTYRLILTRDETIYRFDTAATICESEYFEWRGKKYLNRQGIGTTTHYYDNYKTAWGYDSIYHLALRVLPVLRTTRTIPFCGSIQWNGETVTESKTMLDTLQSIQYGCDSIIITILSKGIPFLHHDTVTIIPGETIEWRGQTITHDGQYEDRHVSSFGCDSIYTLGVGLKADAPVTKTRTWYKSICEGDFEEWFGNRYYNEGIYIDTVLVSGTTEIDSLHILHLTVNPTYSLRERITFHTFPGTYRGYLFTTPGEEHEFRFTSAGGCDSIITVVAEQEVTRYEETVVICPGEIFIWDWDGLTYRESGRYVKTIPDMNGNDSVEHILNLKINYIPDTYISKTICKGATYTFGDNTLTESGQYVYTFHETGCDSVVHLDLNVVNPDTNTLVHHMDEHDSFVWNGETYTKTGVYYYYGTNRFGCDSISVLELTVNKVDTVTAKLTICPNEIPFEWNGIIARQTGEYDKAVKQPNGDYVYYHLDLTVLKLVTIDTTFTICADESVSFNGVTYNTAGLFRNYLSCDTLMNVRIIKHPQQVYETNASLSGDHGYTWTYWNNGVEESETFDEPGTYEFESPNEITGCSEIWRLVLTKDETEYHFVETLTICEGDDFSWRGLDNLSQQGIGKTSHYYAEYQTRTGKDSIYELVLTVTPIERIVRTIKFCGETTWKGTVYTNSAVVYDTIAISTGCYRIERVNLDKETPFYHSESKELPQGTVLHWHGQNITTDGTYYDYNTTTTGCDSIYSITITIIPASPETNQYAEELSSCEGDTILWRNKYIWRSGVYVDTVYKAGTQNIDSIFTLKFTAWPAPKDTIYRHMYTCGGEASIRYQGKDYYKDTTFVTRLATIHGCDSIVKMYLHFNTALFLSDTVKISTDQLPYTWHYRLGGTTRDTLLTESGTYIHEEPAEGSCVNHEELVLIAYPTFLYEQDTTICEIDLPFYWMRGPIEHQGDALQHQIGTTKLYEYRYTTVFGMDSIYRLHLTIDEAPKATEQYYVCEGYSQWIRGKEYGRPGMKLDSLYRDTIYPHSAGTVCDSIVYVEVYLAANKQQTQVVVLHTGESIDWGNYHITSSGTYRDTTKNVGPYGCDSISTLRVVLELSDERVICSNDTGMDVHPDKKYPFVWQRPYPGAIPDTLYTSGTYRDTVFDKDGYIKDLYRMDLTVVNPYDTTVYVHGCQNKGAMWRDRKYERDTVFVDRVEVTPYNPLQPCDSIFHVHIVIDTIYKIRIDTVLCEYQLPFIVGRVEPDTLWAEGDFRHTQDTTLCGCDSIIEGNLKIIPKLTHNDSTFICEEEIKAHPIWLGDTITPAFANNDGGKWADKWQGKWHGVRYTNDTIVWDCNHEYFHHIIVRPHQAHIPEYHYSLCKGDSVQLFLPYDTTWVKKAGIYLDTVPTISAWQDVTHNTTIHNDRAYACDSVTRWIVTMTDTIHRDTVVHIPEGDSLFWNNRYLYATGLYDSIGEARPYMDSAHNYCKYVMTLHLYVDPTYYFRDTLSVCEYAGKDTLFRWADGFEREYSLPDHDSAYHKIFKLQTKLYRFDSIYDLYIDYHQKYRRIIRDTICYEDSIQFDQHHFELENNITTERYLRKAGSYVDTLRATNGCDSIIELRLVVRDRIPVTTSWASIVDRELPYVWQRTWKDPDGTPRSSKDSLFVSGSYRDTLPSIHSCDSIVVLNLTVRPTYLYRDTVDTCAPANTTLTHEWPDGYKQLYTTPKYNDTDTTYADTLVVSNPPDSLFYELYVRFHRTYETHVYDTICAGDSAHIDSYLDASRPKRFYKETGIYRDTASTIYGCDSIITLHLQVWPGFPTRYAAVDINVKDTPYLWPHSSFEEGVLHRDTDSISIPGNYGRLLHNIHGCDSIDSLTLRIHPNYLFEDTLTLCGYEVPYVWTGPDGTIYKSDIYDSGTYTRQWRTVNGFGDSTRILHLRVLPILHTVRQDTICYGDSILFGKENNKPRYIDKPGIYFDTLTSFTHGCDSVIEMRLNVFDNYLNKYTRHIMRDELPYKWYHVKAATTDTVDTTTIISEGIFGYTFKTPYGCDSIDSLTLVVHDDYLYRDSVIICRDEVPYTWKGPDGTIYRDGIYESNEYVYTLRRKDGYSDSTLIRKVTVRPILHSLRYDTLCYGDSILFGLTKQGVERYINMPGVYYDTLSSIQYGCDSIIEMRLNIFPNLHKYHSPVDITDADLPYTWYHVLAGTTDTIDSTKISGFGEFEYVFKTSHGCDSTDHLTVNVHPNYYFRDTITICSDATPYTWKGSDGTVYKTDIYDTGEYTRHMRTVDGFADSIYVRFVDVQRVKLTLIYDSICESKDNNNYYLFNGKQLWKGDIYRDTLAAANGCDSIVELHLTVNKPYYNYIERHIVEGYSTTIFGKAYNNDTTFSIVGVTPSGCDSITDVRVIMHPMVDTIVTVCSNDLPYIWVNKWNGQITPLYAAGLYRNDTTYDAEGKRLFYGLQLVVNQPEYDTIRHAMCEGSSYEFKGNTYTESGIYRDTLRAANGCDKIVTLILTVNKPYYNIIREDILQGQYYVFYGDTLRESTTLNHSAHTPEGCDSTTVLELTVHPLIDTIITVCNNDLPVIWNNRWSGKQEKYFRAGLYRNDTIMNGRKFFYGVRINVNEQVFDTIRHSMCEGAYYTFRDSTIYDAGIYRDTLRAANGCDKIVTLILTVNKPYYNIIREDILQGQYYVFYGDTLRESVTLNHSAHTPEGCDSTTVLELTVHPLIDTVITVCNNDLPVIWNNRWSGKQEKYFRAGLYRNDTIMSGRKFFYGVRINVNEQVFDTIRHSMCEGAYYTFRDSTIYDAGIYRDTLRAANGCDKIVTLILTVNKPYYNIIREDILQGQYYVFYGDTLRESTTLNHSAHTPEGCDSTTVLELTVHPLIDTIITVCNNDLPVIWNNRWSGKQEKYFRAGLYRNDTIMNGRKFFYGVRINVNEQVFDTIRHSMCEGAYYTFRDSTIYDAGIYRDTLRAANGCDKIVTLILTVNKPYYNIIREDILQGQYYVFYGDTLRESTTLNHSAHTPEGCDSTTVLELTVHPLIDTVITVCNNDLPVIWNNRWSGKQEKYFRAGLYRNDTIMNGRKFFYGVRINVNEQVFDTIRHSMCEGAYYTFRDSTIYDAGIYRDTLRAFNGCDKIVTLILTVNKPYYNIIREDILQGQYYVFYGDTLRESVTLNHSAHTPEGCDSTTVLELTVHPLIDTVITVCNNDLPVIWNNRWSGKQEKYFRAGLYRNDTIMSGRKFFYGVRINVNEQVFDTIRHSMCEGAYYTFRDSTIYDAGIYRDTLRAANGCDKIVTLILTVNKPYYNYIERHIIEGNSTTVFNKVYDKDTTFSIVGTTPEGCDSITDVRIIMHPMVDTVVTICASSLPYMWVNKWTGNVTPLYATGIYRNDTAYDAQGNRVYYGLQLIVNQPVYASIKDTICQGDSYPFCGENLTEGGKYTRTIPTSTGCDSIVTLMLTVQPVNTYTERKTILEGGSYFFDGKERTQAGIYSYTVPTANGKCFDTYQLILNVVKPINIDTTASVCENELPFAWRGYLFNEAGTHILPIESTDTSRITMTLNLTVNPVPRREQMVNMCEGGTYIFKNREYTSSCIFYDTIPSSTGCDSIVKYIVRVHPTYDNIYERHISDKDTVNFHDRLGLNKEGTYEWTSHTIHGCDSSEHLMLYVHPSYFFLDSVEICEPDTLFWHGQKITQSGLYYDSLVTEQFGYKFDSVYHLKVKAYPYYTFNEKYEIGEGEVIKLHGHDISKPGEYWDTLFTVHGCDSIFHVVVNKKHTLEFTSTLELCSSETPLQWYDRTLTRSGDYTYTSRYKDSIVHLHLTVNPVSISEKRVVITDVQAESGYIYGGRLYDDLPSVGKKIYTDTLRNQYGCDSVLRLAIIVTKRYSEWTPIPLCPGAELKIDGQLITEAGLYTFERRSKATGEMDSLYRVEVYNAAAYDFPTEYRTICDGDTVFIGDRAITRAGYYDFALKTEDGCDSLLHLDLTVNPSYHFYTYATTPDYIPYTWLGKTYTETGVYERTWATMKDCDSTYILDLQVVPTIRDTLVETICTGQSYTWRDKVYSVDGYYADTVWYADARFSSIYTLRLIVAYPTTITSARTGEICADAENFDIYINYTGQKPTHYSVYFDQLAKREGFEDNINVPFGSDMIAHVNLPKFASIAYQGHPYYVRPDYYTMRIVLDNGVCGISRSDSLTLLVKYPSWIIEQNWNDIVIPLKSDYNGGFEFSQIEWYVNGVLTTSGGTNYLQSNDLYAGDQVVMMATRKGETLAIPTCPLVIQSPSAPTHDTPVIVYPTQTQKQMPVITIEAPRKGEYEIFSSTGLMIGSGKFEEGKTPVTLPAINGIYFIRTHQGEEVESHKVILY